MIREDSKSKIFQLGFERMNTNSFLHLDRQLIPISHHSYREEMFALINKYCMTVQDSNKSQQYLMKYQPFAMSKPLFQTKSVITLWNKKICP